MQLHIETAHLLEVKIPIYTGMCVKNTSTHWHSLNDGARQSRKSGIDTDLRTGMQAQFGTVQMPEQGKQEQGRWTKVGAHECELSSKQSMYWSKAIENRDRQRSVHTRKQPYVTRARKRRRNLQTSHKKTQTTCAQQDWLA